MLEGSKYCSDAIQKHFNKEHVMTKKDDEDFENSTKCKICNNNHVDGDDKLNVHFHIAEKWASAHRDCNLEVLQSITIIEG